VETHASNRPDRADIRIGSAIADVGVGNSSAIARAMCWPRLPISHFTSDVGYRTI